MKPSAYSSNTITFIEWCSLIILPLVGLLVLYTFRADINIIAVNDTLLQMTSLWVIFSGIYLWSRKKKKTTIQIKKQKRKKQKS